MFFKDRAELEGTSRDVRHRNYRTLRMLLANDPSPVSLTDITLEPGIKDTCGYPDRTEIAYCISGAAVAVDLDSGAEQAIGPGILWVAPPGSRFTFEASEPTRLICVFDPPLEGTETGLAET